MAAVSSIAITARHPREGLRVANALGTLTRRRFALVIAPALNKVLGGFRSGLDYVSFVAIGTVGLLVPINTMFAGLGVIVDRESGAQRELLAAPVPRALIVLGNLLVALAVTGLQVAVLIGVAIARGIPFDATA